MLDPDRLAALVPAGMLDGGALDCGSGLVLMLREHLLRVPPGEVFELRSVEPTVQDDLPAWCRMVGHEFLGALHGAGRQRRYFVRRGDGGGAPESAALADDKQRARDYEWRLRARATAPLVTTVYCRNNQWQLGQPASFEEKDVHPSAVEAVLGALAADLVTGFGVACSRRGLQVDDVELTVRGRLHDVLANLGLSDGDPAFAAIDVKVFVSTFADEAQVRAVWAETLRRAPIAATLAKAVPLTTKLSIV